MRQRVLSTIAALLLLAGALPGASPVVAASPGIAPAPAARAPAHDDRPLGADPDGGCGRDRGRGRGCYGAPRTAPVALPPLHAAAGGPAPTHPLITVPAPVQATSNGDPAVPTTLVSRPGLTNADNVSAPGDPYVAVGVSEVVEMVNERIRITDRRGTQQTDITEDAFFGGSRHRLRHRPHHL